MVEVVMVVAVRAAAKVVVMAAVPVEEMVEGGRWW